MVVHLAVKNTMGYEVIPIHDDLKLECNQQEHREHTRIRHRYQNWYHTSECQLMIFIGRIMRFHEKPISDCDVVLKSTSAARAFAMHGNY